MPPVVTPPEIRRYLLGQLDESRAAALESQYFADPALFDEVWAVEHDLVDEYVSNALRAAERAQFERHYLSTDVHRERVATARALLARAPAVPSARVIRGPWHGQPVLRWAMAAALAALFLAAIWLMTPGSRARSAGKRPARDAGRSRRASHASEARRSGAAVAGIPGRRQFRAPARSADRHAAIRPDAGIGADGCEDSGDDGGDRASPRGGERRPPAARPRRGATPSMAARAWSGIATPAETGSGLIASVRVPADRLRPDDYIVTAFDVDPSGVRTELARYAVRVSPQ